MTEGREAPSCPPYSPGLEPQLVCQQGSARPGATSWPLVRPDFFSLMFWKALSWPFGFSAYFSLAEGAGGLRVSTAPQILRLAWKGPQRPCRPSCPLENESRVWRRVTPCLSSHSKFIPEPVFKSGALGLSPLHPQDGGLSRTTIGADQGGKLGREG